MSASSYSVPLDAKFRLTQGGYTYYNLTKTFNNSGARNGLSVPGYKLKLGRSEATGLFTGHHVHYSGTTDNWQVTVRDKLTKGELSTEWAGNISLFHGTIPVVSSFNNSLDSVVLQQVVEKFNKRAMRKANSLNGATAIAEAKKTLQSIKHPAGAIQDRVSSYLNKLFRGSRVPGRRFTASDVADLWLEAQFGLGPLLSDVEGGVQAYRRLGKDRGRFVNSSASMSMSEDAGSSGLAHGPYGMWYRAHGSASYFTTMKRIGKLVSSRGIYQDTLDEVGFTPSYFVPTLYEILPFSWLVDYYTNIGAVLNAGVVAELGWAFTCHTSIRRRTGHLSYVPHLQSSVDMMTGYDITNFAGNPSSCAMEYTQVDRGPVADFAPPLDFRVNLSVPHAMNVAALVVQGRNTQRHLSA